MEAITWIPIGMVSSVAYNAIRSDYNNFASNVMYGSAISFGIATLAKALLISPKLTASMFGVASLATAIWLRSS